MRVAYTRAEEMMYTSMRPAAVITIKSGFTSDGKITAWQFDAYHAGDRPFLGRRGSDTPVRLAAHQGHDVHLRQPARDRLLPLARRGGQPLRA